MSWDSPKGVGSGEDGVQRGEAAWAKVGNKGPGQEYLGEEQAVHFLETRICSGWGRADGREK